MGIFSESDSERARREHNQGQRDGARATNLDKIVHNLGGDLGHSDAYNAGWKNGIDNPEPKPRAEHRPKSKPRKSASSKRRVSRNDSAGKSDHYSSQANLSLAGCIGSLVLAGAVIYGLYYLASTPITRYGGPPGPYDLDGVGLQAQPLAWTTKVVNAAKLNVHSNPSKKANVIWQAQRGDQIAISGGPRLVDDQLWIKVSVDNGRIEGWANRKHISR